MTDKALKEFGVEKEDNAVDLKSQNICLGIYIEAIHAIRSTLPKKN